MRSYKGKDYPVEVRGLSLRAVGITRVEAAGKVHNLKKLEDFDGNYTAGAVGATAAGGGGLLAARNQHGVDLELVSTTQGAGLVIGGGGLDMKIKK